MIEKSVPWKHTCQGMIMAIDDFDEHSSLVAEKLGVRKEDLICTPTNLSNYNDQKLSQTSKILGELLKDEIIVVKERGYSDKRFKTISLTEIGKGHAKLIKIGASYK